MNKRKRLEDHVEASKAVEKKIKPENGTNVDQENSQAVKETNSKTLNIIKASQKEEGNNENNHSQEGDHHDKKKTQEEEHVHQDEKNSQANKQHQHDKEEKEHDEEKKNHDHDEKHDHDHGHHGHGHGHKHDHDHDHDHSKYVVKADLTAAGITFKEGRELFTKGQWFEALEKFTASITALGFPTQEEIRNNPNIAAEALEQLIENAWMTFYFRAHCNIQLENFTNASQDAGRALKLFDRKFKSGSPKPQDMWNYALTLWVRGHSLMEFGAYKEAEKHVTKALKILPDHASIQNTYGIVKEQVDYDAKVQAENKQRIPVTIITGFLGAGKTTLVNHILSAKHGRKLAVIENEYGKESIDGALVANNPQRSDEVVIETSNGCLCCSVRGDLIQAIENLHENYKGLDGILIETTGLADPTPVAQTFYMDHGVATVSRLDGVVAVCDSLHILENLNEKREEGAVNESKQQLAFADVILLNKTDLVSQEQLKKVKETVKSINSAARLIETVKSVVDPKELLGINAFSVERAMEITPDFLDDRETTHDESISSFVVRIEAPIDVEMFENFMRHLLQFNSNDLYRSKGFVHASGSDSKFVFHTVHGVMEIEEGEPWKENEKRESVFVFIGKDLNRTQFEESLHSIVA